MGIKDLFNENSTGVVSTTSIEEEVVKNTPELESVENVREQRKRIERYIPPLDFSDPSNFARYGSAESYYKDAISRIYNQYPYDGSEREIQEFLNESNYVDLHIYENEYPRTTGYAIFSADGWGTQAAATDGWGSPSTNEYISIKGGPHTSSGGIPAGELRKAFGAPTNRTSPNANIYDNDIYGSAEVDTLGRVGSRESNLQYNLSNGLSVEFWLKKDAWISSLTEKEVIFDLWNGEASSSAGYGRFLLYLTASAAGGYPMKLHFASGSNVRDVSVLPAAYTTASIGDGNWHHYAVTLQSSSLNSNVEMKSYVDGTLVGTLASATNISEVTGSLVAHIAALQTAPSGNVYGSTDMVGYGKLSGSIDEFRFWKSKRTERDISRNWWTQVRGGTNTDISNADLGFYFKFNEGITGTDTTDSTVLDYSGRISNGIWTGYPSSNARNIGSAIDDSTATVTGTTEFKDPIIYSEHADVVSLYNTYSDSGSAHDYSNVSSILDSLPAWVVEEDDAKGSGELKKLTQIIGSYFDTLHLQVQHLPKIAEVGYQTASAKPVPFSERLLASFGLHAPETFVEASILEKFANRRDDRGYSLDINDVKNQVYQNIYNNLNFIYKSKGTEKSFRNLIRCYGIDEEVIKLNAYGNNTTFKFEDTYYDATIRKNYIDFNHPTRFDGTVYQNSSSNSETTGITCISGTNVNFANTAEAEIIFPKKMEFSNPQYFLTPFVSASLFGYHSARANSADFGWLTSAADYGLQAYFIKTAEEAKDGHFLLTNREGTLNLTSSVFTDVYDNQKWNLAVRVKDGKYPYASGVTGSDDTNNVTIEFVGYNVEHGVTRNEFSVSSIGKRNSYLANRRRYYAGADRTDTVGAVVTKTDVRVSSVRHFAHYLEDSVLLAHAKDPTNFGVGRANKNIIFSANDAGIGIDNIDLPEYASLAFHWDFSQVTGSDAAGAFEVNDASSGSVSLQTRYSSDGNFSYIVANQYAGRGYFPSSLSSTTMVDKNYVPASKQRLPEVVNSNDAVNVLTQDDDLYPSDPAVSQTFFAFEKSMFGVISQEMINTMATVIEFNNLVGEMTNKYRGDYKDFTRLRTLFFEKIQNNPDLDKFIDYYKWIDNSLSTMIQQLVPASADVADEIRTIVESHIFERSKYRHKMPLLDYKGNYRWGGDELLLEVRANGANELAYDWKHGHAPVSAAQSTNALWWRERAERDKTTFGTSATIDTARQSINDIILSFNSASYEGKFSTVDGTNYNGSTYALRRFASPAKLTVGIDKEVRSGYNFPRTQKPESITTIIKPGSTDTLQVTTATFRDIDVEETGDPILTVKRPFVTETSDNSKIHSPVGQFSSSLGTTEFAGLHTDAYGDHYETPMQGPFTQEHVGGYQHRHTVLNTGADAVTNRQEAWEIHGGDTFTTRSSMEHPPAYPAYQRDAKAKRPVNIRNIQSTTGSSILGNYQNVYEVVQTSGRKGNNSEFVKSEGFGSSSTVSAFIDSANDYAKPDRGRRAHVFVNRFSAPGGPETAGDANGGPFLDLESAEFSPYNEMNSRNLTVRKPLQELLTEHNEQFGYRSGSTTIGAVHKTNKNAIKRLEYTDAENTFAAIATASSFDNYYVQHVIPQSDYQYTWITASYISSTTNTYGYWPATGMVSTSAGLVSAMSFASSSDAGTVIASSKRIPIGSQGDHAGFVPTDFAGLNTTIIEPIVESSFTLGYSADKDVANYYNYSDIGVFESPTENQESFVEQIGPDAAAKISKTLVLSNILSHRQGSYGHPTWKQIRVGQGALGRHYRKNNLYTHTPFGGDELKTNFANAVQTIPTRRGNTLIVSQSVVTSKYHPIKQELLVVTGEGRGKAVVRPLMIMSSYANNVVYFDDPDFANKMGIKIKKGFSAYNQIKNLYLDGALDDLSSPVVGVNRVLYTETVWPSLKNAYTNKIRGRTEFTNNFWRDSRTDRTTLAATKKPENTAGLEIAQSAWSLDAPEDMLTRVADVGANKLNTGGTASAATAGHKAGELQNEYVHYHAGSPSGTFAGALYARKHIFPHTGSIVPSWGVPKPSAETVGDPADTKYLHSASLFRGEALWEAGDHAGYIDDIDAQFSTQSVNPFYDSYDAYFANIKGAVKDYSIIPEFRVEDHLAFYRANGGDYLTENKNMLLIPQASSSSGIPQNSTEDDFFKIYTNSDFLNYFEVIRDDHSDLINPHAISLKCKAMKKFVPYDGFYPAERTTELVKQFMLSYGENVSFVSGTDDLNNFDQNMRNFIKPLFAPGILFNTIKSGLAVDYPIMTSSFNRDKSALIAAYPAAQTASFSIFSNSQATSSTNHDHSAGWDKRIPFEALISPEKYIANFSINDDEPSDFCRVDSTVNWTGEGDSIYRQMMNNFLAESVNFFIKDGKTTGISSLPEEQFKYVTPGKAYGMRIKLWRSMDRGKITSGSWGEFRLPQNTRDEIKAGTHAMGTGPNGMPYMLAGLGFATAATASETFTMYSRPSAFGPALGLEKSTNAAMSGSIYDFSAQNGIYGSHTPPYYDGESWVDLIYFPEGLEAMNGDLDAHAVNDPSFFQMRTDLPTLTSYQPKIEEIFATPSPEIFGTNNSSVPLVGSFVRKWRFDEEELKRDSASTYHKTGAKYGPAAGPWVDRWAMQADATLNLFDVVAGESDTENKWRIQTKFETPMLNFKDVSVANDTLTLTSDTNANAAIPRGMWHQFGKLPEEGEGVYLQVTDIPTNWLSTHPSATLKWDIAGDHSTANRSPRLTSGPDGANAEAAAYYGGYSLPLSTIGSQATLLDITSVEIGSLIDVCGFNTDPVRIGDIASSSEISEAIVAVPFMEKGATREFFTIPSPKSAQFSSLAGRSMSDQINLMQKYVFPPSLDFLENSEVTPVAMYIFEFKHRFSKQELSHMWQNLPPKIGTEPAEATSTITHALLANELMGDHNSLVATQTSETPGGEMSFTPLEKVKWMVFKVKQKALSNYYDVLEGKEAEANALDANKDKYTNNWPYDFCSIVELAKMDVEVEFGEKEISATEARLALRGERAKGTVLARNTGAAAAAASTGTPGDGDWVSSWTGMTAAEQEAAGYSWVDGTLVDADGNPVPDQNLGGSTVDDGSDTGGTVGTSDPPSYGDD